MAVTVIVASETQSRKEYSDRTETGTETTKLMFGKMPTGIVRTIHLFFDVNLNTYQQMKTQTL